MVWGVYVSVCVHREGVGGYMFCGLMVLAPNVCGLRTNVILLLP